MKTKEIENRLADIEMIKRAIKRSENSSTKTLFGITLEANLIVLIVGLIASVQMLVCELYYQRAFDSMAKLNTQIDYTIQNMASIGFILALMVGCLYFVVWRAAKHSNEQFSEYLGKNFKYLKNLSFLSDLLIKFMAIVMLCLAGQLLWVAPFLLACIGDFLIQGKYFTFKLSTSMVLGIVCLIGACLCLH